MATPRRAVGPTGCAARSERRDRAGLSPLLLGGINNDGLVDIRDYGVWRQALRATDCGNLADLNTDCLVDIRDYGFWRQNCGQSGPTATATPPATGTPTVTPTTTPGRPGSAYVANQGSNNVTVIDTTTNTVVGTPIAVGTFPYGVGVDPTVHRVYVVNSDSNTVSAIDTTTNTVSCPVERTDGPIIASSGGIAAS